MKRNHNGHSERPVLITGGAEFIGTNIADRLLKQGKRVLVFDNFSRPGVERNWQWLRETYGGQFDLMVGDVRDTSAIREAVARASAVFHCAAQVAVTTSLVRPLDDFEINARGTLNLLEAIRAQSPAIPLVYTTTNKVYGALDDVALESDGQRYVPAAHAIRLHGFSEQRPVDFHSPYGCSKGAAGQYVADYARSFGLPTVVFRMSCIYGPHQFGTEDQGWVAHFVIRALEGKPIVIYGDGKQVRDLLFADDLVSALLVAQQQASKLAGRTLNMGGGPSRAVSVLEVIDLIGELTGRRPQVRFDKWRVGDQRYYVSDTREFQRATGWSARVSVRDGLEQLTNWLRPPSAKTAAAANVPVLARAALPRRELARLEPEAKG